MVRLADHVVQRSKILFCHILRGINEFAIGFPSPLPEKMTKERKDQLRKEDRDNGEAYHATLCNRIADSHEILENYGKADRFRELSIEHGFRSYRRAA